MLEGISCKSFTEFCHERNIPCEANFIHNDNLTAAQEVFIATVAGGTILVTRLNVRILDNGE